MNRQQTKKKPGVLDVIIIVSLCVCIAAAVSAFVFSRDARDNIAEKDDFEEYVLSFEIYGMRKSTAQLLSDGDVFFRENGEVFGTVSGQIAMTPAAVYAEKDDGTLVKTYAPENGDFTLMDVSGTMIVRGAADENGILLVNGDLEIAPAKTLTVHSGKVSAQITVTGIEKVAS